MDFSEKWGRDVEEAVRLALEDLHLTEDQVKVTVLEEPSKGFFGIGSKLAKVRVERKPEQKPDREEIKEDVKENIVKAQAPAEKKPEPERRERPEKQQKRKVDRPEKPKTEERERYQEPAGEMKIGVREKPADLVEIVESPALDFLREVTQKMGLNLTIKAFQNEDCLYMEINGKDSGTIIGKRGQTLDSIQYLTSLVVNKDSEKYIRVIVDAENYREKRERTLEQLANRLADKVKRTGKSVRLEPMNPYERKVIHATLQKYPGITTRSEGEEPYRRVIIEQK